MRTIEIRTLDTEAYQNHANAHPQAVSEALAYLTQWGMGSYGHVDIFVALDGEMTACYYANMEEHDARARPGYVLGAIFHEPLLVDPDPVPARYSFHS